jgi:uncharacterized protein with beta-barrel porin domain
MGGTVTVSNSGSLATVGDESDGIYATSVGGGGGSAGAATGTDVSLGASSGDSVEELNGGGLVTVTSSGKSISTAGMDAMGIYATSIGGGGGDAAVATAKLVIGGSGGAAGDGGGVSVTNASSVTTAGAGAVGIEAMSVGGGGGDAAGATSGSASYSLEIGGNGGEGGVGGEVSVDNLRNATITTDGAQADAIFAQSVGGGGGAGGTVAILLEARTFGLGGSDADVGDGGTVNVTNLADLSTKGEAAFGIFAQSVGGGGGYAGMIGGVSATVGNDGTTLGAGGAVNLTNGGAVTTSGAYADAIIAQSVGDGGGVAGGATGFGATPNQFLVDGGESDDTGGGAITATNNGSIVTRGQGAIGLVAQSVGGGGGIGLTGGSARTISLGGGIGQGGDVTLTDNANIATSGAGAFGLVAQSVGGGGGLLGATQSGTAYASNSLGDGNGGNVSVSANGAIFTSGAGAAGIIAQSVAGGGGIGGVGQFAATVGVTQPAFAGTIGGGGQAGVVSVAESGSVTTTGANATGIFAQSAGGSLGGQDVKVTVGGVVDASGAGSYGVQVQSYGGTNNAKPGEDGQDAGGTETVFVQAGGVIAGATGVQFLYGVDSVLTNDGTVKSTAGINGMAVDMDGPGSITNSGVLEGSIDVNSVLNVTNTRHGVIDSGSSLFLGNFGEGSLTNSGTLSPGGVGRVETTTLSGSFTQTSTGVLNINLDLAHPSMSELIVTGQADVAGTLFVTPINLATSKVATTTFTVLDAGFALNDDGLKLAFTPSALLSYSMTVTGSMIQVNYGVDYSPDAFGTQGNLFQLGEDFDRLRTSGNSTAFNALMTKFFAVPTAGALATMYDTLSGEGSAATQETSFTADDEYLQAARDQARQAIGGGPNGAASQPLGKFSLWATGYGGSVSVDGAADVGSGKLDFNGGGMAFGAQTGGGDLVLGADAGFDTNSFQVASRDTTGTVEGEHVGVYAAAGRAGFYALGQLDGDFFQNTVLRDIDAVGLTEATMGRFHSKGATARLEIGRAFDLAPIRLTPFAAVQGSEIFSPDYRETAAPGSDLFTLGYEGQTAQSLKSDLGLELAGDWKVAGVLTPYLRADWLHEFDPAREVTPFFSTFGSSTFTEFGATPAENTARVEAGFNWAIAPRVTASASYVGDVGANTLAVGGMAGIRVAW